jgi:Protein of unknown function (DUF3775)
MLAINPDKVCFLIVKAREFQVKEEPMEEDPGSNASDDGMTGILEDYADDPTEQEFKDMVLNLNVDEQATLLALVLMGRGDYTIDEWPEAMREARDRLDADLPDYLLGTALVGDYLEEALTAHGYSCSDVARSHL